MRTNQVAEFMYITFIRGCANLSASVDKALDVVRGRMGHEKLLTKQMRGRAAIIPAALHSQASASPPSDKNRMDMIQRLTFIHVAIVVTPVTDQIPLGNSNVLRVLPRPFMFF